jgi:hypothetical protein
MGGPATFTALDDGDGASALEEPDAGDGGWATGEPLSWQQHLRFGE